MLKSYWTLFYLSLIGSLFFLCLLIWSLVLMRSLFLEKAYGLVKLAVVITLFLFLFIISGVNFVRCCKDYHYIYNGTFEKEEAKVIEFMYSKRDYDGNGQIINAKPKFLILDRNEYIVLNAKDVEIGKTYIICYYPNTKICKVIEEVQ